MSIPNNSEQWLLYGECRECRKNKYCSKLCSKAEQRRTKEIADYISEKTGMGKIMDILAEKLNERR